MTCIPWKLILTVLVAAVGLYLIIGYWSRPSPPSPQDPPRMYEDPAKKKQRYRAMWWLGWVLLTLAIALGIYFHFNGGIVMRATMPSDCSTCQRYVQRHRGLRPYSAEEYSTLKSHAAACNTCSNMCFDEIQLIQRHEPGRYDLRSKKKACAETTKHALLARSELERIESTLRDRQVQYLRAINRAGGEADWGQLLPAPPTQTPK